MRFFVSHLRFRTEILHEAEELWHKQGGSDAGSEVASISSGCSVSSSKIRQPINPDPFSAGKPANTVLGPTTIIAVNGVAVAAASPGVRHHHHHHSLDSLLFSSMDEPQVSCDPHLPHHPALHHQQFQHQQQVQQVQQQVHGGRLGVDMAPFRLSSPKHNHQVRGEVSDDYDPYDYTSNRNAAIDLEPIDFEHFVDDEPPEQSTERSQRMFRVSPPYHLGGPRMAH